MAKAPKQNDKRDDIEIDEDAKRCGDEGLRRALHTPPKPRTAKRTSFTKTGATSKRKDG